MPASAQTSASVRVTGRLPTAMTKLLVSSFLSGNSNTASSGQM